MSNQSPIKDLSTLFKSLSTIEGLLADAKTRLNQLEKQSATESSLKSKTKSVTALNPTMARLQKQFNRNSPARQRNTNSEISTLKTTISTYEKDISNLKSQISSAQSTISKSLPSTSTGNRRDSAASAAVLAEIGKRKTSTPQRKRSTPQRKRSKSRSPQRGIRFEKGADIIDEKTQKGGKGKKKIVKKKVVKKKTQK